MHSLSDVKRVVFIHRCEFWKKHKAKYRTIKPIPNYFQPRIKICHTFGIQSLSFNFSWKGRNFMLMAGIAITLIYWFIYLFFFFSRNTSTHLCIQLHVYPANGFNMHSLSDVKRVVFIYRCEFLERTTKQSIERSNQSRTTFNPELKFATLSGYSLLASISC